MKTPRNKAYVAGNYDGRVQAMTAATSLTMAAFIMGTTASTMRNYGWYTADGPDGEIARMNPGVVFTKPIMDGPELPWMPRHRAGRSR